MKKKIAKLSVNVESMDELIDLYVNATTDNVKTFTLTPNLDFLRLAYKDKDFFNIINNATFSTIDGKPLLWIAKWLHIKDFKHKISGSDLAVKLLDVMDENGYSLFLFGGKDGVAENAKEKINEKYPNIKVVGTLTPDFGYEKDEEKSLKYIEIINKTNAQFVYLCTGAPKTEKFYSKYQGKFNNANYFSVGATIDFIAGNIKRAPKWMSNCGLEWLYRLSKDFKRLFKRYWLDFWFLVKMWYLCHFRRKKINEEI